MIIEFVEKVESIKRVSPYLTYLEILSHIADDLEIEVEEIAKMVTGPLKDKLQLECSQRRLLSVEETLKYGDSISIF